MFDSRRARRDIDNYLRELHMYTDFCLSVHQVGATEEYWMLMHSENGKLTEGSPDDILKRIQQIAREHGLDWFLAEHTPDIDSWWPEEA